MRPRLKERWLAIPGFRGYEASDLGNIRSLPRSFVDSWGRLRFFPGKVLKQTPCGNNRQYRCVELKGQWKLVHQLVLLAFIGPCPKGLSGCHRDDVGHHNWINNLYWGTAKQNAEDRGINNPGIGAKQAGELNHAARLTKKQVLVIKGSCEKGVVLARRYGVKQATICDIRKGRTWRQCVN